MDLPAPLSDIEGVTAPLLTPSKYSRFTLTRPDGKIQSRGFLSTLPLTPTDYDVMIMDVRPQAGYSHVQIVFEAELNRYDGNLGYDMWFDDFEHGYGRCSVMRCGEFPPPLLKGSGATFGHDVALENTCTDGDNAHSVCQMNCPTTHPVHHFAHYWQEIICNPSYFWNQPLYTYYTGYCQAPSCNYFDIIPPKNGWYSCSDEGYEGSVCTFGCNSVDYTLNSKAPYRL